MRKQGRRYSTLYRPDQIVREDTSKKQKKVFLRCQTEGCDGEIESRYLRSPHFYTACARCRRGDILVDGVRSRSPMLIGMADRILAITKRKPEPGKRTTYTRTYTVKCPTQGCTRIFKRGRLTNLDKHLCHVCAIRQNRTAPVWRNHFNTMVREAVERSIPVHISFDQFRELCAISQCFYCNKVVDRTADRNPRGFRSHAHGFDRMDNDAGYTMDNVASCCGRCNWQKGARWSARQWLVIKALKQERLEDASRWCLATDQDIIDAAWLAKEAVGIRRP